MLTSRDTTVKDIFERGSLLVINSTCCFTGWALNPIGLYSCLKFGFWRALTYAWGEAASHAIHNKITSHSKSNWLYQEGNVVTAPLTRS